MAFHFTAVLGSRRDNLTQKSIVDDETQFRFLLVNSIMTVRKMQVIR